MHSLQETIRPSADLRNHYNEISRQCREENKAVIITVNGRGDTVSLSYEEYKRMKWIICDSIAILNFNIRTSLIQLRFDGVLFCAFYAHTRACFVLLQICFENFKSFFELFLSNLISRKDEEKWLIGHGISM